MRTRDHNFFDIKNYRVLYGIDVCVNKKWCVAAINGKQLIFDTEKDRDAKRAELRRLMNYDTEKVHNTNS